MLLSILALALVFAAFCCCASADYSGTCGDNVNWSLNTATGELTLSGAGPTWDYTYDPDRGEVSPFENDGNIRSVVITSGITRIGTWLFDGCHNIQSVSLPGSLKSIGSHTFNGCSKLSELRIPKNVTTIDAYAFYGCSNLEDVTILSRIVRFADNVFRDCSDSLIIHGFAGSTAESYARANGISFEAFPTSGKWGGLSWNLASGVLTISGNSSMADFADSSDTGAWRIHADTVETVKIEHGVRNISKHCFEDFSMLKSVTIPSSVTGIGNCAFYNCRALASLIIPDSVTFIGDHVFSFCRGLTSITIPEGVTSIGAVAFSYCSSLTGITIPSSVTGIGVAAFLGCSGLTSVAIPSSMTLIDNSTFYNCCSLKGITIPSSVTFIGSSAFLGCNSLENVYYTGSEEQWKAISISINNDPLQNATIHYFSAQCDLVLPAALTTIEADAFRGISASSVFIPNSVTNIQGNPFAGSQVTTICGYKGSAAQTFAKKYGYTFVSVS